MHRGTYMAKLLEIFESFFRQPESSDPCRSRFGAFRASTWRLWQLTTLDALSEISPWSRYFYSCWPSSHSPSSFFSLIIFMRRGDIFCRHFVTWLRAGLLGGAGCTSSTTAEDLTNEGKLSSASYTRGIWWGDREGLSIIIWAQTHCIKQCCDFARFLIFTSPQWMDVVATFSSHVRHNQSRGFLSKPNKNPHLKHNR